jgi:hypothetical protein
VTDYAESTVVIVRLRRQLHDALLRKDWDAAAKLADRLALAAHQVRLYCLVQLDDTET